MRQFVSSVTRFLLKMFFALNQDFGKHLNLWPHIQFHVRAYWWCDTCWAAMAREVKLYLPRGTASPGPRICAYVRWTWIECNTLAYTCNEMYALVSSVAYKQSRLRHSKPKTEFRLKQTKPKIEYVGAYILLSLHSLTPFLLLLIPGTETRQTCKHASDNVLAQIRLADCVILLLLLLEL